LIRFLYTIGHQRCFKSYNCNDIVPKRMAYVGLPIRLSQRSCRSVLYCIVLPVSNSSRVCNDCSWPSFMAFHFSIFKLSLVNNQGNRTNIKDKKIGISGCLVSTRLYLRQAFHDLGLLVQLPQCCIVPWTLNSRRLL
jgi:hypothetical protein